MIRNRNSNKAMQDWNTERARHWHLFLPPARPSIGEVAIYNKLLTLYLKPGAEGILFGSTPELRTLAHEHHLKLSGFDRNQDVFNILRPAQIPSNSETFYHGDWVRKNISKRFDFLLADGSINMLSPEEQKKLIVKIAKLLRPNGLAFVRVHLLCEPPYPSINKAFEAYRRGLLPGKVFSATRTAIDMLLIENQSHKLCFNKLHSCLRELHAQGSIEDDEFNEYEELARFNTIEIFYLNKTFLFGELSRLFKIIEIKEGGDYALHEQHPILVLSKI